MGNVMDESLLEFVRRAERYATAAGLSPATVSARIFADSKRLEALRNGAEITVGRFRRSQVILTALETELADRRRREEAVA